jgi:hypothetical protein
VDTSVRADPRKEVEELSASGILAVGAASGLVGGLVLAAPVVIWDWVRSGHRALELPMAATAWPFGLVHFSHDENLWWPIVVGIALLAAYWAMSGVAFVALADRFLRPSHASATLVAGVAWSFVTFMLSWYMLLPIARDGAPFRAAAIDPRLFTAPNWVWILGFALSGLVIAGSYGALRRSAAMRGELRRVPKTDDRSTSVLPAA